MTLKEHILAETQCKDFAELKRKLLNRKKYTYGCYTSEIKCKGFRVSYTSNPNHFASFFVSLPFVGMTSSYGLDKDSITQEGIKRSCQSHYLTESQLNVKINTLAL